MGNSCGKKSPRWMKGWRLSSALATGFMGWARRRSSKDRAIRIGVNRHDGSLSAQRPYPSLAYPGRRIPNETNQPAEAIGRKRIGREVAAECTAGARLGAG